MEQACYICDVCGRAFNKCFNFKRHMQGVHRQDVNGEPISEEDIKKEKLNCDVCKKQYVWRKDLQRHMSIFHSSLLDDSKLKKCSVCSYTTRFKADLKRHTDKHINGVIKKCVYCEKIFKKRGNFKRHVQGMHKEKTNEDSTLGQVITDAMFTCDLCLKKYNKTKDFNQHKKIIHTPLSDDSLLYKCLKCLYSTRYKASLKRHMKVHMPPKENHNLKCSYCSRTCIHKRALRYHINKCHQADEKKPVLRRKCCLCSKVLYGYKLEVMRSHFEKVHNIPMIWENHIFNSLTEFEAWKATIEKETKSAYIIYYSYKSIKVYKCHRSGSYTKSGQDKRKPRMIGSCKINSICPSVIKVQEKDNKVLVSYLPSHVGHKNELKHIRLTLEERKLLADQLAEQIPHEEILNSIQGSMTNGEVHRFHLTSKRDLFNIEQSLLLNKEATKQPLNVSSISIEAWVEEFKTSRDVALIAYKPQGEILDDFPHLKKDDFVLIFMTEAQKNMLEKWGRDTVCIDMTHDINNIDLQLYTLLTLDEIGEGFPAAFMFTNKAYEASLKTFLEYIKCVVGPIRCDIFLSDSEETFYSTWEEAMGSANTHIFNTWHILKAWKVNLEKKITILEKKEKTEKVLSNILYKLDETEFFEVLEAFLKELEKDPDTKLFFDYFDTKYVVDGRYQLWAYCYRTNAGINTHMSLENFNILLEQCYLAAKDVKGLHETVCAVLSFLKDELFDVIIKMKKDKLIQKLQTLRQMHKESLLLNKNNISQPLMNFWYVSSPQQADLFETVKRVKDCNNCFLHCSQCNSCLHEFVCSCSDNTLRNNMCKHIHLVKRTLDNRTEDSHFAEETNSVGTEDDSPGKLYISIPNEINSPEIKHRGQDLDARKQLLLEKIQGYVITNLTTFEQVEHFENILEQALATTDVL